MVPGDIKYTTKWCHTNFKLNQGSDQIGIFNNSGKLVASLTYNDKAP